MEITVSEQMWCLFCSLLSGLVIGVIYDILRVIRNFIFTGKISVFICDFLFVAVFAVISVFFSMAFSRGNTRYFIVMGETAGFLLFKVTLGRITLPCAGFIIKSFKLIFNKILIKSKKISKKVLQPAYKILYNICNKRYSFAKGTNQKLRGKR